MSDEAQEQQEVGQAGESTRERERSTIGFPYGDLEDAVSVAKGIHAVGGTSCQMEQLAAHMKMAPNGGGFRLKTITAKIFGLTKYSQGVIRLTPLGSRICDPKQESAARAQSFLEVALYRAVYERYKTTALPPASALENEMVGLGVVKKQADKARQTFQRSAQQAGFFAYGPDRLVLPAAANHQHAVQEPAVGPESTARGSVQQKTAVGDGEGNRHQLIAGLIKTLPEEGGVWKVADRHRWLQLAAGIFDFVYLRGTDDQCSLRIILEDSAK